MVVMVMQVKQEILEQMEIKAQQGAMEAQDLVQVVVMQVKQDNQETLVLQVVTQVREV
jgi:hypothetical protein